MRIQRYYIYSTLLTLVLALVTVSCSDDLQSEQDESQLLQLIPYNKAFSVEEQAAKTRAVPDGYQRFSELYPTPDNNYAKIAVYLANQDGENWLCEKKGEFTHYNGDSWLSDVHVDPNIQYYVYGYMPSGNATGDITSSNYAEGATLTLTDLSTIVPADVCIIVGAKKGKSATEDIISMDEMMTPGQYGYKASPALSEVTDPKDAENYIYLLMDHIYSCVNLEFKVTDQYDALRTIKLTKVAMKTTSGPSKVTATVTLTNNSDNPMSCNFTDSGDNTGTIADQLLPEETNLTTSYLSIPGYFTPGKTPLSFDVISTYDVLDKKGNVVRANCVATNKVSISDSSAAAGKSYTVRLIVTPTYLYQLSDKDLDNPSIVVSSN